jgi:hypothetical protein
MTPVEAFELAIDLSITAPTDEQALEATKMAEYIAMLLTPEQVAEVKAKFGG